MLQRNLEWLVEYHYSINKFNLGEKECEEVIIRFLSYVFVPSVDLIT
jgi:hypothetical protein